MAKIKYLSYKLEEKIPIYGKKKASLDIKPSKSLAKGDSCNTYRFSMENHWGTHIDAPAHFFKGAKKAGDYAAEDWLFKNPCIINLPLKRARAIELREIKGRVNKKHDIVLIKTGFSCFRGLKPYSFNNPVVSPEIGVWLRSKRPLVRAIGIDFISLGSYQNRELSQKAHRAFLNPGLKGRPVLIIEDMDLGHNLSGLDLILVAPLRIKNIDSLPCTIFGLFNPRRGEK